MVRHYIAQYVLLRNCSLTHLVGYAWSVNDRPKKLLHAVQDETYRQGLHELHETQKMADEVCRYDLDDLDCVWLANYNELRKEHGRYIIIIIIIIIIIERRDFGGIMSDDCKDTLQTQNKTVRVRRSRTSKVSIRYRRRQRCRNQESFWRTVPSSADAWKTPVKIIIIMTRTIFMVLSSWHSHCESSPGSFDECRLSAWWPPTLRPNQPIWAVSPLKDWLLPSTDTIAIYYYYSAHKITMWEMRANCSMSALHKLLRKLSSNCCYVTICGREVVLLIF